MKKLVGRWKRQGRTTAFVPTMGFLHGGHLSLMKKGRQMADRLIISIFINPAQFAPGEDFATYPKNMERDLLLAEKEQVDLVFTPHMDDIYPDGYETFINLEKLPKYLCGISRPTFFRGVATIVFKLFNIVKPDFAVFGEKDFQQLTIIRKMVKDLDLDVEVVGSPIVREPDGLAMSSRNAYLNTEQRKSALCLVQSLEMVKKMVAKGEVESPKLIKAACRKIVSYPETEIDYVSICDSETLEPVAVIEKAVLMALAVKIGKARLIDNMLIPFHHIEAELQHK